MQLRFPQRRDQQTWTILRFILPSQLGVKSTPNAETGGNKVKNYNETLPDGPPGPSEDGHLFRGSRERPRRVQEIAGEALRGAAALPRLGAPDLLRLLICLISTYSVFFRTPTCFPHGFSSRHEGERDHASVAQKRVAKEKKDENEITQRANASLNAEVAAARSASAASRARALNTARDAGVRVFECARAPRAASLPRPPAPAARRHPTSRGRCGSPPHYHNTFTFAQTADQARGNPPAGGERGREPQEVLLA